MADKIVDASAIAALAFAEPTYVWLARAQGMPLVTLDRKLASHAKKL